MQIKLKHIFLFIIGLNFCLRLTAQDKTVDSLKNALKNARHDTTRCKIYLELIEAVGDEKVWPIYNQQLFEMAEKGVAANEAGSLLNIFYLRYLAGAISNKGYLEDNQGNVQKALEDYYSSLMLYEKIKEKFGIAGVLNNIACIYEVLGDFEKSLEFNLRGLKLREEIKDKQGVANTLINIGAVYFSKSEKAKEKSVKDLLLTKALAFFKSGLSKNTEINNQRGISIALSNIGQVYEYQGDLPNALLLYTKSLKIKKELKDKIGITNSLNKISHIFLKRGKLVIASDYASQGLQIAKELSYPYYIRSAAMTLKTIWKKQGKFKQALDV